jgi:UDP-N-acetyl-D-mannosaminuronic acid transferase (WecB/TagA/CpsF family)
MNQPPQFKRILGIPFLVGSAREAVDLVSRAGGLVVMPSAPALKNLPYDPEYRQALLEADFAIPDSSLMVILWNLIQFDRIPKISGLKYLRTLISQPEFRQPGASFWVMPTPCALERNQAWLGANGITLGSDEIHLAPIYGQVIEDAELLRKIEERRPHHVVLGLGGGVQERLGLYLKRNLSYRPAIHCIGAAIAFLSGDQVKIPVWVDSLGLGWMWRTFSNPRVFAPRYWGARNLAPLLLRYRDRLPSLAVVPISSLRVHLHAPVVPDTLSDAQDASEA